MPYLRHADACAIWSRRLPAPVFTLVSTYTVMLSAVMHIVMTLTCACQLQWLPPVIGAPAAISEMFDLCRHDGCSAKRMRLSISYLRLSPEAAVDFRKFATKHCM